MSRFSDGRTLPLLYIDRDENSREVQLFNKPTIYFLSRQDQDGEMRWFVFEDDLSSGFTFADEKQAREHTMALAREYIRCYGKLPHKLKRKSNFEV